MAPCLAAIDVWRHPLYVLRVQGVGSVSVPFVHRQIASYTHHTGTTQTPIIVYENPKCILQWGAQQALFALECNERLD